MALTPIELASGVVGSVVLVGLALAVVLAAPSRRVNRALGLYLALWAANYATFVGRLSTVSPFVAYNAGAYSWVTWVLLMAAYLAFLGHALATPLVAPLRRRWAQTALWLVAAAAASAVFVAPTAVLKLARAEDGTFEPTRHALVDAVAGVHVLVLTFALVAAFDALRRAAPGSLARDRARGYLLAFGFQDAGVGLIQLSRSLGIDPQIRVLIDNFVVFGIIAIVTALLLARAMLKFQLFALELKVKWTLSKGTLAAVFVTVVFAASEGAQLLFGGGNAWVGLGAGALLVFALAPLQRLADRVADAAMPRVQDTEEYRTVRKREVYRAAVESALQDGVLSEKERDVLATLATQLGLSAAEARALERQPGPPAGTEASP